MDIPKTDRFTFWTWSNGRALKVSVNISLEFARYLVDSNLVESGVWESLTNRIYL